MPTKREKRQRECNHNFVSHLFLFSFSRFRSFETSNVSLAQTTKPRPLRFYFFFFLFLIFLLYRDQGQRKLATDVFPSLRSISIVSSPVLVLILVLVLRLSLPIFFSLGFSFVSLETLR